jgi:hypothetical protein
VHNKDAPDNNMEPAPFAEQAVGGTLSPYCEFTICKRSRQRLGRLVRPLRRDFTRDEEVPLPAAQLCRFGLVRRRVIEAKESSLQRRQIRLAATQRLCQLAQEIASDIAA